MRVGRLIARLVVGGLFIGHGTQKLFGWFEGPGIEGTEQMMEKLELHPARRNAVAAGLTEAVGGGLFLVGALTPLAGSLLTASMVTAIRKVHLQKGFWNTGGGYEFNLTLIAAVIAIVEAGPGRPSVDAGFDMERCGPWWAAASLAAGMAGSALTIERGQREAPADQAVAAS